MLGGGEERRDGGHERRPSVLQFNGLTGVVILDNPQPACLYSFDTQLQKVAALRLSRTNGVLFCAARKACPRWEDTFRLSDETLGRWPQCKLSLGAKHAVLWVVLISVPRSLCLRDLSPPSPSTGR